MKSGLLPSGITTFVLVTALGTKLGAVFHICTAIFAKHKNSINYIKIKTPHLHSARLYWCWFQSFGLTGRAFGTS
jgi:hypothetical protein